MKYNHFPELQFHRTIHSNSQIHRQRNVLAIAIDEKIVMPSKRYS